MKFEITYDDGIKNSIERNSWHEILTHGGAVIDGTKILKIERIDARILRENVRKINNLFHEFGKKYHDTLGQIVSYVWQTLNDNGFEIAWENELFFLGCQEGAKRNIPIGKNCFLTFSWYKMESGRYKFIGYVVS